jgi:hypothetical protein
MAAFLVFLAETPGHFGGRALHHLGDNVPTLRPNTPPRHEGGKTILKTKRACNGCQADLGDATDEELEAAVNGLELPDVRGECITCAGDVADTTATILGDDVLYRCATTDRWIRGTVTVVSATGLRINLVDGLIAIDVKHGFGPRNWATLDEVIEHNRQVAH